jgi:hypothetical protein
MFRKRAVPAAGEVKDRHVEQEHGVMLSCASSKNFACSASEIILKMFPVHADLYFCNANRHAARHYAAVAGFCDASFEGAKKSGVSRAGR